MSLIKYIIYKIAGINKFFISILRVFDLKICLLLFITATFLLGCEKLFFDDLSETSRKSYDMDDFNTIKVYDSFDVVLKQDSIYRVDIEAPAELIDNIKCIVYNDTLKLSDINSEFKTKTPSYKIPKVYIYFPEARTFRMHAPGTIKTEGTLKLDRFLMTIFRFTGNVEMSFDVDYLRIVTGFIRSAGYYEISGNAKQAYFWMRNGSWIDATNLKAEDVRIRNNSVMDSKIYVSNELKAFLNTHGNIYYQGDPEKIIIEEQSSKGKLIPLK